ncbi:MAG TPA: hypothetical protein DCK93_09750 [Blastocatellia bacterium]|jgi:hypothetical protein|nr:hypothetical protein [Blastocatellia bacterium]
MKSKAKILMIFVSGLLVGALATFIILGKRSEWVYADCYTTSVMDKAFEATELRAHRQDESRKKD